MVERIMAARAILLSMSLAGLTFGALLVPKADASPECEPAILTPTGQTTDTLSCFDDHVDIAQWKGEALTTGTWCGDKRFVQMDGTTDDNMATWILKEESPDIINQDFLFPKSREIIIGWHFKSLLTYDAVTYKVIKTAGDSLGVYYGPAFWTATTMQTVQGKCAGDHDFVTVGGLTEEYWATYTVDYVFSGAKVVVTKTTSKTVTVGVNANIDYQWTVGISLDGVSVTTPKVSFGGSIAYSHSEGFAVNFESFSKGVTIQGTATGGDLIRAERVGTAMYGTGPSVCAAHYALYDSRFLEGCIPAWVELQ